MNWNNGVLNVGQIDSILILPLKVVSKKRCVIVARARIAQLIYIGNEKKFCFTPYVPFTVKVAMLVARQDKQIHTLMMTQTKFGSKGFSGKIFQINFC